MAQPLVSVIVPVYGARDYLEECVDSIRGQSYRNLQIILADDGSTDGSGAICDRCAEEDPRILVLHKENGGVSSARNAGLRLASGEFVTFCDSDDTYAPDWLRQLVQGMARADAVVGNFCKCYPDGTTAVTDHEQGLFRTDSPESRLEYCMDLVLTDRHAWEVTTRMFRMDLIREHGLEFCETCGNFGEDLGFVLEYSLYADRVLAVPAAGYRYRIRPDSMMGSSVAVPKLNSVNEVSLRFLERLEREFPEVSDCGPVLHFLIMMNQYSVAINLENYKHIGVYLDQIRRRKDWEAMTRRIGSCRELLYRRYGKISAERILNYSRYCLDRFWLGFKIRRFLLFKLNGYRD